MAGKTPMRFRAVQALVLLAVAGASAAAAPEALEQGEAAAVPAAPPAPDVEERPVERVVVFSDRFARWDRTRWRIDSQVALPFPVTLYGPRSAELQVVALDLRLVLGCELGAAINRKLREVACEVEDAALSAAPWLVEPRFGQEVLDATDAMLTGLQVDLHVSEDGRVTNLGISGIESGTRRENITRENLRQILSRAVVGFHLRSPSRYVLGEQWVERDSELFSMPIFLGWNPPVLDTRTQQGTSDQLLSGQFGTGSSGSVGEETEGGGFTMPGVQEVSPIEVFMPAASRQNPFLQAQAPASMSRSDVAHRMDPYKGTYVVQSHGTGSVDIGAEVPITFKGAADAVSVFAADTGVMQERVWTVRLAPTASSVLSQGVAGWPYWHQGRLQQLAPGEESEVGRSALLSPPGITGRGALPPWPALF